jgi:hypothetical protein
MLDEPKGGYYASTTSAPLFRDVLNAVVTRFGVPMNSPAALQRSPLAAVDAIHEKSERQSVERRKKAALDKIRGIKTDSTKSDQLTTAQAHPMAPPRIELQGSAPDGKLVFKMPELQGLTIRETLQALQGYSFQIEANGSGWLKAQWPEAGSQVSENGRIRLRFDSKVE